MKRIVFGVLFMFLVSSGLVAQENGKPGKVLQPRNFPRDWHLGCMEVDTVSGADVYRAHDYLKGRTPKAKTIVAIIDADGDVTHKDLKNSLWVNRKEIPGNGIDDDNNGFVDDIHGWNFLGLPNGRNMDATDVMDWEFLRLRDKFTNVDTTKLSKKEKEEYHYFVNVVCNFSVLYKISSSEKTYNMRVQRMLDWKKRRDSLGDDVNNLKTRSYGNNTLCYGSSIHGTHVGGIVGAVPTDESGAHGIADVELMFVRILGAKGDELDEDVASAICYAVDNGARVINMSFNKFLSPNKKLVNKAMRYAEKKGVLLVNSAGNNGCPIDKYPCYPNKFIGKKREVRNFICVGSLGPDGDVSRFSNYGKINVDIFAPGEHIYSTVLNNKHKLASGTSMAAPIVTGVAALIWNYFPELTMEQVKQAILEGAESWKGRRVTLPRGAIKIPVSFPFVNFEELCGSGGVLNALNAVKLAEKMHEKSKGKR
ncbi:S8 family serine peptidase [Butyricimonas synergistica]|uniref:S8 family serine peptidase n=1 Tax=Butyricimonas synergistica TaxID=544644 RepID=UPI000684E3F0|nr:S8 family serine peptidase [Butyricimonas synergistica]